MVSETKKNVKDKIYKCVRAQPQNTHLYTGTDVLKEG